MINMVLKTTQVCAHPHLLWHLNLCSHQKPTGVHPGILTSSRYFEFIQIFWVHPGIRWTTQYPYRWDNLNFVKKSLNGHNCSEKKQLLSKSRWPQLKTQLHPCQRSTSPRSQSATSTRSQSQSQWGESGWDNFNSNKITFALKLLFLSLWLFQVQLSTLEKAGLISRSDTSNLIRRSDTSKDVKFLINYYLSGKVCVF